jgi:hypothetical protein
VFSRSSKARLTVRDLDRFPDPTLFHTIARAVCRAGCLPRKELYEAWEVARRVRRVFRGGRVVDLAGGHGLLAHVMLILDDSSPDAVVVDKLIPPSAATLHQSMVDAWPRLSGRIEFMTGASIGVADVSSPAIRTTDVVVSSHACGALTDRVLDLALDAGARVAVLPCCHHLTDGTAGALTGWVDEALAIDLARAFRVQQRGYRVWTQTIPGEVTPKNRLLLGRPAADTTP